MSKLFVVDVDDVLLDFSANVQEWWRKRLGRPVQRADRWEYAEALGVSKKMADEMWDTIWDESLDPFPGALNFIRELKVLGLEVVSLSARKEGNARAASMHDLRVNGFTHYLDRVEYVDRGVDKGALVASWAASFFLDDSMKNCLSVADKSPGTRVMLFDRPHNVSQDLDPPYLRVKTYHAVLREVRRGL